MKKTSTIIFISFLSLYFTAYSQQWENIGPPGGRVYALAIDPKMPEKVFAGTNDGFLFKSTDGGSSSELVENGFASVNTTEIAISPLDTNLILSSIYRSTDGRINWHRMETAGFHYAFHIANENIVYAVNGSNIIISYDKGLNWDILKTFTEPLGIVKTTSLNDSILFLLTLNNLYKSIDGGNNWSLVLTAEYGDMFGPCFAISDSILYLVTDIWKRYVPTNPTKFYKSTNMGNSWEIDSSIIYLQSSPANVMVVDPINSDLLYIATGDYLTPYPGDIWKSTDRGYSWIKKNVGLPTQYNRYLYSLAINPLDQENLYVGSYGWGVYKTSNGGESWDWTNLTKAPVHSIHIDENIPDIVYACTIDEGVLKTTNGGLGWQPLNLDIYQTVQRPFFRITFDPNNGNLAYIASQYGVFKSTDGGNNWNITSLLGDFDHYVVEISVHPRSSDTLYAGIVGWLGRKGLYRSVDGTDNWTNLNLTNGEEGVVKVLFNLINPDMIYVAALSKGIYKSTDRGISWHSINNGLQLTDPPFIKEINSLEIVESDPNTLYTDNGGVVKTTNGGENWFRIDSMLFELDENIKVSRVAYINNKIYASSNDFVQGNYSYYYEGGLYTTSDNGLSWQKIGRFQIGSPGPGEIKSNPNVPSEIFITTMAGIYKGVDTITCVEITKDFPESPDLFQNFPNPFNPTTSIEFKIPYRVKVLIEVFNGLGQKIQTLLNQEFEAGDYKTEFNSVGLSSGIYFYRLQIGNFVQTRKMVLLK